MFCPECGKQVEIEQAKFCHACGFDLSKIGKKQQNKPINSLSSGSEEGFYCSDCGAAISFGDSICKKCGANLEYDETPSEESSRPPSASSGIKKNEILWLVMSGLLTSGLLLPLIFDRDRILEYSTSFFVFCGSGWLAYRILPSKMKPNRRMAASALGPFIVGVLTGFASPLGIISRIGSNVVSYVGAFLAVFLLSRLALFLISGSKKPGRNAIILCNLSGPVLFVLIPTDTIYMDVGRKILLYFPPMLFCLIHDLWVASKDNLSS